MKIKKKIAEAKDLVKDYRIEIVMVTTFCATAYVLIKMDPLVGNWTPPEEPDQVIKIIHEHRNVG